MGYSTMRWIKVKEGGDYLISLVYSLVLEQRLNAWITSLWLWLTVDWTPSKGIHTSLHFVFRWDGSFPQVLPSTCCNVLYLLSTELHVLLFSSIRETNTLKKIFQLLLTWRTGVVSRHSSLVTTRIISTCIWFGAPTFSIWSSPGRYFTHYYSHYYY